MVNSVNYAVPGQVYLPGTPLRSPGNLTDRFTPQQPMVPGRQSNKIGPLSGSDGLKLSGVAQQPPGRLTAVGNALRLFASNQPVPVRAKGAESRSFAGVPATIFWDQRNKPNSGPRIPAGFKTVPGTLPKGLSQAASYILDQGNPLGTYTPFTLGGKNYVALNEYHTHYASRPKDPPGKIYAVTVFQQA
ncbi:MAG: hypothetical protein ACAI44_21450 [Candidatus Sericytochromatia bacterium]